MLIKKFNEVICSSAAKKVSKMVLAMGGNEGVIHGSIVGGTISLLAGNKVDFEMDKSKNKIANNNFNNQWTTSSRKYGRGRV